MTTEQQVEYLKARGWIQGAGDWWKHPRYQYTWFTWIGALSKAEEDANEDALKIALHDDGGRRWGISDDSERP